MLIYDEIDKESISLLNIINNKYQKMQLSHNKELIFLIVLIPSIYLSLVETLYVVIN